MLYNVIGRTFLEQFVASFSFSHARLEPKLDGSSSLALGTFAPT